MGGQSFSELLVFEHKAALDRFKAGEFGAAAGASAVVLKSGVATTPNSADGVAVIVQPVGGDGGSRHWRAAVHVSAQVSPAALGHPHVCGPSRSQRHAWPPGMRRPLLREAWRTTGAVPGANEAAPSFPSAQQDADGSGGAYALPSQHVPSRMLQTPLCSKGGDLSSRWRPRELCDQSRMSAYRTCKGRCAWRARMLAWMQGEGNRVIRAPVGAHKRGAPPPRLAWVGA